MSTRPPQPLNERGSALTYPAEARLPTWDQIAAEQESLPELIFPQSVQAYQGMLTDPQVSSLLSGLTTPTRLADWYVDRRDCPEELASKFAQDIGLPVRTGDEGDRQRPTTKWDETLRFALLGLPYGFAPMEQVGYRDSEGAFRYAKLGPRLQSTIREIRVDRDGGLNAVVQEDGRDGIVIPVNRLVMFTWERIGDNWYGKSILRALYQPWLLRDELLRIDLIKHRRNGMGVPLVELPEGATQEQTDAASRLAAAYRVGEASGGALPYGMKLRLAGVEGATSEVLDSIKYCDEVMARALLEEVRQLGTTSFGSRALGETHEQTMAMGVVGVMEWLLAICNEHIAEDWAVWNGLDPDQAPAIGVVPDDATIEELGKAVAAKVIEPDEQLEAWTRRKLRLPQRTAPRPAATPLAVVRPSEEEKPVAAATGDLPRSMTVAEQASGFDPRAVEASLDASEAQANLVMERYLIELDERARQLALSTLHELDALDIEPSPEVLDQMQEVVERQRREARGLAAREVASQGVVTAAEPGDEAQDDRAIARRYLLGLGRKTRNMAVAAAEGSTIDGLTVEDPARAHKAVSEIIRGTSGADYAAGLVSAAAATGRQQVWGSGPPPKHWLASEILDKATCDECDAIDGTRFYSWDEAQAAYPSGRYSLCLGRDRCRGQLIAVYQ